MNNAIIIRVDSFIPVNYNILHSLTEKKKKRYKIYNIIVIGSLNGLFYSNNITRVSCTLYFFKFFIFIFMKF